MRDRHGLSLESLPALRRVNVHMFAQPCGQALLYRGVHVRAHLLRGAGRTPEAMHAFDRAIGLTEDPATRQFLLRRRGEAGIDAPGDQPAKPSSIPAR